METRTMRAIKIDTENRTITEIEIGGLKDMQKAVGGLIEVAQRFYDGESERNTLFVAEEGLLKNIEVGFVLTDEAYDVEGGLKFTGNGLICGFQETTGKTIDCNLSIDDIKKMIAFVTYQPL